MRLIIAAGALLATLVCSGCGRVAERIIGAPARSVERREAAVFARDLERDATSRATRLQETRRVFKYTTEGKAQQFEDKGFAQGVHFTTRTTSGRPLTAAHAADRYGLQYAPRERLTVNLPAGTRVKQNKVIGGSAGYGEITIQQPLPARSITGVTHLEHPH